MKGRARNTKILRLILRISEDKGWMRNYEIRNALKELLPDAKIGKKKLIRYLNWLVKTGYLEKITEPGKTRYRLSNKGGMTQLASMISASIKVQSDLYPDLQKGCVTLKINKGKEFWGLLIVLKEDWRAIFTEKWKDEKWGGTISRGIVRFIDECVQPAPAFVMRIPDTDLFFFKPPLKLLETMNSAVHSGDFEMEPDVIIHAMNEWKDKREKGKTTTISLDRFPCVRSAVNKGVFETPKDAIMQALENMEVQLRAQSM